MRVLILSKACLVAKYQTKLTALAAQPGIELTAVVPPSWRDERGTLRLETRRGDGYELIVTPIRFNGHFHIHHYPQLPALLERYQPDLLHIDEEPYNLATFLAARAMQRLNPRTHILFFSWQNILKRYPPPFSWMERQVFRQAHAAIAGNREAKTNLERKGFKKPIEVIPQFGVPESFRPQPRAAESSCVVIGYAGRLVREKGIHVLLKALAQVQGNWELRILGSGPLYNSLERLARELKLEQRVHFNPWVASSGMPQFYNSLDLLVVPSLTQPNWKEQFGRVLMEAMASGVPVIGSDSGEIPNVIGDAGLVIPEGDVAALARAIQQLVNQPALRRDLGVRGADRARKHFSQARIAAATLAFYQELAAMAPL